MHGAAKGAIKGFEFDHGKISIPQIRTQVDHPDYLPL